MSCYVRVTPLLLLTQQCGKLKQDRGNIEFEFEVSASQCQTFHQQDRSGGTEIDIVPRRGLVEIFTLPQIMTPLR